MRSKKNKGLFKSILGSIIILFLMMCLIIVGWHIQPFWDRIRSQTETIFWIFIIVQVTIYVNKTIIYQTKEDDKQ